MPLKPKALIMKVGKLGRKLRYGTLHLINVNAVLGRVGGYFSHFYLNELEKHVAGGDFKL